MKKQGSGPCPESLWRQRTPRPSEGVVGSRSFICPCRAQLKQAGPAAAGHSTAAERGGPWSTGNALGWLLRSGDRRGGRPGSLGLPRTSLPSPALGTRLACPPSHLLSHLLCSSGNQLLGLKLEGSGSSKFESQSKQWEKKLWNTPWFMAWLRGRFLHELISSAASDLKPSVF